MTVGRRSFPEVEAHGLDGRIYRLPGDLDGDRNVLVVAFRRDQQRLVDQWLPSLLELERRGEGLRVYEVPTISSRWSPLRWFIDGGMSRGIGDPDARARTLTIYTEVGRVVAALGLADTGTIAILLVDRAGRITWRGGGEFDRSQLRELETELS